VEELVEPRGDSVERFLMRWHESPPPRSGFVEAKLAESAMPPPLRRLYELVGRWPGVIVQNHLVPPDRLEEKDGKTVFYVENQGVCEWSTRFGEADPPVWMCTHEDVCETSFQEEEPLSRWLLQMVVFEATFGSPHHAVVVGISADALPPALDGLRTLPLNGWRWPVYPTRFYVGEDVLTCVNPTEPSDESSFDVVVGAKGVEPVRSFESLGDRPV
jgi:hypothetical protein